MEVQLYLFIFFLHGTHWIHSIFISWAIFTPTDKKCQLYYKIMFCLNLDLFLISHSVHGSICLLFPKSIICRKLYSPCNYSFFIWNVPILPPLFCHMNFRSDSTGFKNLLFYLLRWLKIYRLTGRSCIFIMLSLSIKNTGGSFFSTMFFITFNNVFT